MEKIEDMENTEYVDNVEYLIQKNAIKNTDIAYDYRNDVYDENSKKYISKKRYYDFITKQTDIIIEANEIYDYIEKILTQDNYT